MKKSIHITNYTYGGTGRAVYRIANSVAGEVVSTFPSIRELGSKRLVGTCLNRISYEADRLNRRRMMAPEVHQEYTYLGTVKHYTGIETLINLERFDVIHLHGITESLWNADFFELVKSSKKKVIWTLHDMWAFTGGCHYSDKCVNYLTGCHDCRIYKEHYKEEAEKNVAEKIKVFCELPITLVGCSKWITTTAEESYIINESRIPCVNIPNPTEPDTFFIEDKVEARRRLGLPLEKNIIVAGAMALNTTPRKGANYLFDALNKVRTDNVVLCCFGRRADIKEKLPDNVEYIDFGAINDDFILSGLYSAADMVVAPSLQENFAGTVLEPLTVGTPVVAFDIGGMPDMIINGVTGYLAKPFDVDDLAIKIDEAFDNKWDKSGIRDVILKKCAPNVVGAQYMKLYEE